jgi:uncharacterized C2H2 Zn-finger protein
MRPGRKAIAIRRLNGSVSLNSELKCPRCGTENVRDLDLVRAEGSSHIHIESESTPTGLAIFSGAPLWAQDRRISSHGTIQSELARSLGPPAPPRWGMIAFAVFLLYMLSIFLNHVAPHLASARMLAVARPLTGLLVLVAAWLLARRYRDRREQWEDAVRRWDRSFLCNRCGMVFEFEFPGPAGDEPR